MTIIKTDSELKSISWAGKVVGKVLKQMKASIQAGVTGKDLEAIALKIIKSNNCKPNFLGYEGFPAAICVSRNDELIHGIPNRKPFQKGDLITVDVGCKFQKFHADAAISVAIPPVSQKTLKILKATQACLQNVVQQIKPNMPLKKIGTIVEETAQFHGFTLSDEYCGHGIGKKLHESPYIYNTAKEYGNSSLKLIPGMVFCVEPMLLSTKLGTKIDSDGWTVKSVDQQITCHLEHMLLMTDKGVKILSNYERFIID